MLSIFEENIAIKKEKGKKVVVNCHDGDTYREEILKKRGFAKTDDFEYLKWQALDRDMEAVSLPQGCSIHSLINIVCLIHFGKNVI